VLTKHQVSLNKQERESLCNKLIIDVGLSVDSLYKYPHQFSGGQRQRVVIARALAANPEFIIADESVSALDVSVQAQVLNLLNDLKAEYNLTFLFISHDLSVVNYMSDRVMVMREGEIVEYGTAEEIYTNPRHSYTQKLLDSVY
jgi:peptide/nickel transport system ATP-binding protein